MAGNIQEKIEDKIIDCINSGVAGRLIVFKPEANALGADLAVERKGKYKEGAIYFQINSVAGPVKSDIFVKDFLQESFKAETNFYLLFVYFDEVRQKLGDHVWLVPSLEFRDIGDNLKSPDGGDVLRFEAQTDAKQKNKYSRFVVNINNLGKFILEALERGGKFDFGANLISEIKVNKDSLMDFLFLARQNTYAAGASFIDNPRLLSSKQLEFQKGDYFYRDIYFDGEKRFIGQEIIYLDSKPIWGMNYMGSQIGRIETAFLKEALLKSVKICRVGKTCEYEKRGLKYQDQGQGSLEEFFGKEEIFQDSPPSHKATDGQGKTMEGRSKSIYKLNYRGGLI